MDKQTWENKKGLVSYFLKHKILLSGDIIDRLMQEKAEDLHKKLELSTEDNFLILNKDIHSFMSSEKKLDINWHEWEKALAILEKTKNEKVYKKFLDYISSISQKPKYEEKEGGNVNIVTSYPNEQKKRTVEDFVKYFNIRFKQIEKLIRQRPEFGSITSIIRVLGKKNKENVSIIGMIKDIAETKNGNLMLNIEDQTGTIKILINHNKPEIFQEAKTLLQDEVIGIKGVTGSEIVFCTGIIWPEIPMNTDLKKSHIEEYAIFLSDLHIGSNKFLADDLDRFMKWINGDTGSEEQREIAKKVKYLFIIGDLVDGCGIYPGQDKELLIKDIYEQYRVCAEYIKQIPKSIKIIICPGNHDAIRLAEPQPPLLSDFSKPLTEIPNVILVSNPSIVNIGSTKSFPGFNVLLYHGYSFDYFVANVDSIRSKGGYNRPDIIMKYLLKRRHLSPNHLATLYVPYTDKDPLAIEDTPDFFVTGHLHKSSVNNYRNVTLICGSCWQSKTAFQEKMGHTPEPGRVPIVNLKTRDIKVLRFSKE